jgi:hypothetical protein
MSDDWRKSRLAACFDRIWQSEYWRVAFLRNVCQELRRQEQDRRDETVFDLPALLERFTLAFPALAEVLPLSGEEGDCFEAFLVAYLGETMGSWLAEKEEEESNG